MVRTFNQYLYIFSFIKLCNKLRGVLTHTTNQGISSLSLTARPLGLIRRSPIESIADRQRNYCRGKMQTMPLVSNVLGHMPKHLAKIAGSFVLILLLLMTSCSKPQTAEPLTISETAKPAVVQPAPAIKQVETPELIRDLDSWLDAYEPQVQIRQPQAEAILADTDVSVILRVQDLPIYKDKIWGMGPHIELLLDNHPWDSIYDIEQPIILENLTPGTHTIRAFATRPWHESFKNEGAYAQVTFHILAKTNENSPASDQPLITYGAPVGTYGAEPILLDFYLTDTPLHQVAQDNPAISDWRVQYIVNGESFTLKDWESIYIEGLRPGQNWVQLMLIDDDGNPIEGVFNNTVRLVDYDPSLEDSLAKIIRGDVTLADVGSIIDPTYEPSVPETPDPESTATQDAEVEETVETVQDIETLQDADITIPEVIAPEVTESEVSKPEMTRLEFTQPQVTEPDITKSEEITPETAHETSDLLNDIPPNQTSDKSTENAAIETDIPENSDIPEDLEIESNADETDSLETGIDNDVEANFAPAVDAAIAPTLESTTETLEDSETLKDSESQPATSEAVSPSIRQSLQRLYDYRKRFMQPRG